MRKSIVTFLILLFSFTFTVKAQDYSDPTFDFQNDANYQALASDFRKYTVCGAIHDSLLLLVSASILVLVLILVLGLAMAQGKEDPDASANLVKGLLTTSQSCRDYVSTVDYSDIE